MFKARKFCDLMFAFTLHTFLREIEMQKEYICVYIYYEHFNSNSFHMMLLRYHTQCEMWTVQCVARRQRKLLCKAHNSCSHSSSFNGEWIFHTKTIWSSFVCFIQRMNFMQRYLDCTLLLMFVSIQSLNNMLCRHFRIG